MRPRAPGWGDPPDIVQAKQEIIDAAFEGASKWKPSGWTEVNIELDRNTIHLQARTPTGVYHFQLALKQVYPRKDDHENFQK